MEYKNSVLEDLIKDPSNYVNRYAKFPIYVATIATLLSEDVTELEYLHSFLTKKIKVRSINV